MTIVCTHHMEGAVINWGPNRIITTYE